jgi:hypothetical protein
MLEVCDRVFSGPSCWRRYRLTPLGRSPEPLLQSDRDTLQFRHTSIHEWPTSELCKERASTDFAGGAHAGGRRDEQEAEAAGRAHAFTIDADARGASPPVDLSGPRPILRAWPAAR